MTYDHSHKARIRLQAGWCTFCTIWSLNSVRLTLESVLFLFSGIGAYAMLHMCLLVSIWPNVSLSLQEQFPDLRFCCTVIFFLLYELHSVFQTHLIDIIQNFPSLIFKIKQNSCEQNSLRSLFILTKRLRAEDPLIRTQKEMKSKRGWRERDWSLNSSIL